MCHFSPENAPRCVCAFGSRTQPEATEELTAFAKIRSYRFRRSIKNIQKHCCAIVRASKEPAASVFTTCSYGFSGGFRGGSSRLRPPPPGRRTDAVTVLLISDNGRPTAATPSPDISRYSDRSTVKHALQNIQNDCHQWLSRSFRVHQIRFQPGFRPGPRWGSLQRSPDTLAGLRGTYF